MSRTCLVVPVFALLLVVLPALSAGDFPGPGWKRRADPVASPLAVPGGQITEFLGPSPKSLNYYLDNNVFSARVFGAMYETLIDMNSQTLEYEPALAEQWSISADKKTFTFRLDTAAKWSDGTPITAADVAWTYKTILAPENLTGVHKISLERLNPPEVLDSRTIRFTAKEVHWQNLGACGGFHILPKHIFGGRDFNKINFEFPVVSGPYRLGEIKEGISLSLERRADWWRRDWVSLRNTGNFQTIKYRFYEDRVNAFEAFKKGDIDMYPVYTARLWMKETNGDRFRRNWIVKQKIYNHHPIGFQGFAMNLRRPPFDDVRVRKAMAHLVDRRTMNRTLMYDQYFLHRSYFEDLYDSAHPCPNELTEFDREAARNLLAAAGWRVNPENGILAKDGRTFEFTFLSRSPSSERFLAIYDEALKDVGIRMKIEKKDWAAWAKDMDEFNFDMTWAAWGAGLFKNPEPMWASKEANRKGGSNITGFSDRRVDELIEKQKAIFDVSERHAICRRIDRLVYEQFPYVLLWNINYVRLLYWQKFGTPDCVIGKYSTEDSSYWWEDEDAIAELEDAIANQDMLPPRPAVVRYDQIFRPSRAVELPVPK